MVVHSNMTDNTAFYNKYVQVLKARFDNLNNDVIHLETQLILAKEELDKKIEQVNVLQSEIEKLKKKTTRTKTTESTEE